MNAAHLLVLLVIVLFVFGFPIWVGIDANKRGMSGGAWAAGVFLLWIVFFPLYLILRKPVTATTTARACPACGEDVARGLTVCPTCHHDFAAAARA